MNTEGFRLLITEARFIDPRYKQWLSGDLYQFCNIMVFDRHKPTWGEDIGKLAATDKIIMSAIFYEGRDTIVFPLEACQFNEAAYDHIKHVLDLEDAERPRIITLN